MRPEFLGWLVFLAPLLTFDKNRHLFDSWTIVVLVHRLVAARCWNLVLCSAASNKLGALLQWLCNMSLPFSFSLLLSTVIISDNHRHTNRGRGIAGSDKAIFRSNC